jgi:molybdopterin-guanine dinucleotide biosynthesis protein A
MASEPDRMAGLPGRDPLPADLQKARDEDATRIERLRRAGTRDGKERDYHVMMIRLPTALQQEIKARAAEEERSIASLMRMAARQYLKAAKDVAE